MASITEKTLDFNGKIVILASGTGSNAEALMKKAAELSFVQVCAVITDNPQAGVISKARNFGVPCHVVVAPKGARKDMNLKRQHEAALAEVIDQYEAGLILLAGYMRILSADFVRNYNFATEGPSRIINIHPSLLPAFKGKNAYEDAWRAGSKVSGCTIHFIDANVDEGTYISQDSFERKDDDQFEDFKKRGLSLEHVAYTRLLQNLEDGRLVISNDQHGIRAWYRSQK